MNVTHGKRYARDFAAANLRMYQALAERKPDASWLKAMAVAAQSWVQHRGVPKA